MGDLEAEISSTGDTDQHCGHAINTMLKGEREGVCRIITQQWVGGARGGG